MTDLRQTKHWAEWLASMNWKIEDVGNKSTTYAFIKKIPLIGIGFTKIQRFESPINWEKLGDIKKKYRIAEVVLEPDSNSLVEEIKSKGFKISKSPFLPTKTRIIDLNKNGEDIYEDFSSNIKRIIDKGSKKIKISPIEAEIFYQGWRKWGKCLTLSENNFEKLRSAFSRNCEFWGSFSDIELLSGLMLLYTKDSVFYFQTWTNDTGRNLKSHPILVWETIKIAKAKGVSFYNFEGIQDDRFPLKNWDGFSEFKRRFGGSEKSYPGCFIKWL